MNINDVIVFLQGVPVWAWVVFGIVVMIVFGDRKRWEYELNIPFTDGFGHGEIEIEASSNKLFKREKQVIEIELELEPDAQNKVYDIFLNGDLIYSLSEHDTDNQNVRIHKKYTGAKPNNGDMIEIRHNSNVIISGKLHKD